LKIHLITALGFAAGLCTTGSLLPQVLKTVKTRRTRDISLGYYLLLIVGLVLWTSYGILLKETPIILANVIALIFAGIILGYKIKYG